jgi:6,7-dimethyl-8-ribityllumazine synthase
MSTQPTTAKATKRSRKAAAKAQVKAAQVPTASETPAESKPVDRKHTFGKLVMLQSTIVRDLQAFDTAPEAMARTKRQWYGKHESEARAAVASE